MFKLILPFSFLFHFVSFSQDEQLINYPIERLNDNCYSYYVNLGKDSINETSTRAEIYSVDATDNCVPAEYTVYMTQYFPVRYHFFATWRCGDSSSHYSSYTVPKHCQYWAEPDSNTLYYPPVSKYDSYKSGELKPYRPDSVQHTDMDCVARFYQFENDSVRCDTLFEKDKTTFNLEKQNGIQYWQCSYYYEQKHGKEIAYYHVNEVSRKCMNGDTNLKKYEGAWKYGKRKGKWYYYDIYGELIRIEVYRKGVCKKIKKP